MDGGDSVSNGDVSYRFTHAANAALSLRWAHMGLFCLIDAFMFYFNEPREFNSTIPFLPKSDISCLFFLYRLSQHDF